MGNKLNQLKYKIASKLSRCYGRDELSTVLIVLGIILSLGYRLVDLTFLYYVGCVFMLFGLYRIYSTNYNQRSKERMFFLKYADKPIKFVNRTKRKWTERKTHKFVRCPKCGAHIRLPRGKGEIVVTCPKCTSKFNQKT